MNRRTLLKTGGLAVAGATVAPLALTQSACGSTRTLAKWTGIGMEIFTQMSPILTEMGAGGVAGLVARALPVMSKLKSAFESNNNATAFQLFDNLTNPQTGIIVEISNAVGVLQGQKRVILLGLLASAQVIMKTIAANIVEEVPPAAAANARAAMPSAANSVLNAAKPEGLERAFAASRF